MAIDKVRPLKIENTVDGSQDDDGYPTELNPVEDYVSAKGVSFENSDGHFIDRNPATGEIRLTDPTNGEVNLSELLKTANHKGLNELVHDIAEPSYYEATHDVLFNWRKQSEIWWTNSSKTTKIREILYTYDGIVIWKYASIVINQYNGATITDTITGVVNYHIMAIDNILWSV